MLGIEFLPFVKELKEEKKDNMRACCSKTISNFTKFSELE